MEGGKSWQVASGSTMRADMEEDAAIAQAIEEYVARESAPLDADPSIFAPWGIMFYPADYKSGKCDRPD